MDNTFTIEYLPLAEEDIKTIFDYIRIDDPNTAVKILDQFDKKIDLLTNFPYMGAVPRDPYIAQMKYRFLVVETFLVFYVVMEELNKVEIRRVFNSKQKYDAFL
ncbi:type II toxin-antitoxin system RelE/ParE family toxin [Acidaminobacter hydrogenoformans]|uniref:Plasmid stabilization system protein ParE n=1 Tax=Acidaminobacter hydrogenoformans DSM 2784 TaxID=1120920 RepID=A0A1G5S3E9_9FIRM|nr:type II toxin-antitoxin system RelE/ParE family toxin [Acidaminobacter hydrogenoformans]SCZ80281.1 Plasmid stabilization system protein ParE [Acidaminobacter hydrogenoformans DSM 2784]